MSYLEVVKKQSPYGHLPNFAILSKNKLYLPNVSTSTTILGKWSLEWIDSERFVIGFVEQDDSQNVYFKITSCYEFYKNNELRLINRHDFIDYWSRVYKHEPLLTLVQITVSDYYTSNGSNVVIGEEVASKSLPKEEVASKSLPKEVPKKEVITKKLLKEKVIDSFEFTVCKTDKPDVYYVYKGSEQISTCLISNLKTSRYMQDVFEHKNIGERIGMNLKLHENTKRYIPIIG
jgi:hypothetical protein